MILPDHHPLSPAKLGYYVEITNISDNYQIICYLSKGPFFLGQGVIVRTNGRGYFPRNIEGIVGKINPEYFFGDGNFPFRLAIGLQLTKPYNGSTHIWIELFEVDLSSFIS